MLATNLVSVGGALVRGHGDDLRVIGVGHVVDGQSILVVAVADVATEVLGVGTLVNKALSLEEGHVSHIPLEPIIKPSLERLAYIVGVAIVGVATESLRLGWIRNVEHDGSRATRVRARLRAHREKKVLLLMDNNVVASARPRQVSDVTSDISHGVEGDGALAGVNVQKL
jgi:hypothetical protein